MNQQAVKKIIYLLFLICIIAMEPSCNHNKIACPTYKESFPETRSSKKKKPKPGDDQPSMKVTKHKMSKILPPGYKPLKDSN